MKNQFPPPLIAKCQRLLREQANLEVTEDQAEIYMEKFGRLMLLAVKILDRKEKAKKIKDKHYEKNNSP